MHFLQLAWNHERFYHLEQFWFRSVEFSMLREVCVHKLGGKIRGVGRICRKTSCKIVNQPTAKSKICANAHRIISSTSAIIISTTFSLIFRRDEEALNHILGKCQLTYDSYFLNYVLNFCKYIIIISLKRKARYFSWVVNGKTQ